jgi:uncharacterized protein YqeY
LGILQAGRKTGCNLIDPGPRLVYDSATKPRKSHNYSRCGGPFPKEYLNMMRDKLSEALKEAMKAKDSRRLSTVRLIQTAIKDRDIANRGAGKDAVSDDDILQILQKMVKQREESAKIYEDAGRAELATQEREEIVVIKGFMPEQLSEQKCDELIKAAIADSGAQGLRDMGKVMAVLKEKYPGQMDFAKASGVVKDLLK